MITESNYRTHVMVFAWINIVCSAMFLLVGIFAFFLLTGIGMVSADAEAIPVLGLLGTGAAVFFGVLSIPGFVAGYGMLAPRRWGRVLGLIVAAFSLFNAPVGTLVGLYGLYVLTRPEAEVHFGDGLPGLTSGEPAG